MKHQPLGIPYADAGYDDDGYHVTCPVCNQRIGLFSVRGLDEDGITKGTAQAYALHYRHDHPTEWLHS